MKNLWPASDGWVFRSLAGTSADRPSRLADLIQRADGMEHSVLEEAEFTGAMGRLCAAGLAAAEADTYWLTEAGRTLDEQRTQHGGWAESVARALRKVGPPEGEPIVLRPGQFEAALDEALS